MAEIEEETMVYTLTRIEEGAEGTSQIEFECRGWEVVCETRGDGDLKYIIYAPAMDPVTYAEIDGTLIRIGRYWYANGLRRGHILECITFDIGGGAERLVGKCRVRWRNEHLIHLPSASRGYIRRVVGSDHPHTYVHPMAGYPSWDYQSILRFSISALPFFDQLDFAYERREWDEWKEGKVIRV